MGFGSYALYVNTTGIRNTAVGLGALQQTNGDRSTAIGNLAGSSASETPTLGSTNITIGFQSGR